MMFKMPPTLSFSPVGCYAPSILYYHLFVYLYSLGVLFTILSVSHVDYLTSQSNLNIVKVEIPEGHKRQHFSPDTEN